MKFNQTTRFVKLTKPKECGSCTYSGIGEGYCKDTHVEGSKLAIISSFPGSREIETGEGLTGPEGFVLDKWVLPAAGLGDIKYSKGNVVRCHPTNNAYPTGKHRKSAELVCRQYDTFKPSDYSCTLITVHPRGVLTGKYDTLPLLVNDFTRVKKLLDAGNSVCVLMGTEALELWTILKGGVEEWRGHWEYRNKKLFHPWPYYKSNNDLTAYVNKPLLGFDLEWNPSTKEISLISIATPDMAGCWTWGDFSFRTLLEVFKSAGRVIGFNIFGHESDLDVLASNKVNLIGEGVRLGDLMLAFHLLCPQFAGKGFLDLWTCCSMYTMSGNWKRCRGLDCSGPCPEHDFTGYNTMDSLMAARTWTSIEPELALRGML